jgi:hypothetical protein
MKVTSPLTVLAVLVFVGCAEKQVGPADSFTPEHAMTIANEMEAIAAS